MRHENTGGDKSTRSWRIIRPPLHPRFDMPTRKELFDVFEGDNVKLIFEDDEGMGERMWIAVTRSGNADHWEGTLDNDPIGIYTKPRLRYGSRVKFHPYDVIDVDLVRLRKEETPVMPPEQVPLENLDNDIKRKWYKEPQYLVPIGIGVLGTIATLIAAVI